ncbi:BQ2448_2991 [Microbotryum intermedium]|uniref:BQ2448_2991 protein n=1 Tax=Microbotryum intermedium TaxID=269621 RepID=A0A238FHC1_9BASI|nr:BQ2448_2991 [Microbotryum intermedium]
MSTLVVDVAAATTRPLTTRWWSAYVTATGTGSAPSAVEALVAPGATSAFVNAQWLQLWFLFASLAVLGEFIVPPCVAHHFGQVSGVLDRLRSQLVLKAGIDTLAPINGITTGALAVSRSLRCGPMRTQIGGEHPYPALLVQASSKAPVYVLHR